jgi:thiol-disulfide isomerase/thioredoxin
MALGTAISGLLSSFSGRANAQSAPTRPTKMPAITLLDIHGVSHDLGGFQGKVLMVNFWATWCPPCRAEMPSIERLHLSMRDKDFVVLGINQGESVEKIQSKLGIFNPLPTFPLLVDPRSEVGAHFKVRDLPTSLIFNKQGALVGIADGARDFASAVVRQNIEELLKQ